MVKSAVEPVDEGQTLWLSAGELQQLGDEIAVDAATLDAGTHGLLTKVRRFDAARGWLKEGARTCGHWLSYRIGRDLHTAREYVRMARALGKLPAIDAAFARGEISFCKVRAMTRIANPLNEEHLLGISRETTGAQLERLARRFRRVLEVNDPLDEGVPRADIGKRWIRQRGVTSAGMARLELQVYPEEASVLFAKLDAVVEAMGRRGDRVSDLEDVPAGTPSTADEKEATVRVRPADVPAETPAADEEKTVRVQPADVPAGTPSTADEEKTVRVQPTDVPAGTSSADEKTSVRVQPTNVPAGTPSTEGSGPPPRAEPPPKFGRVDALMALAEHPQLAVDSPLGRVRAPFEVILHVTLEALAGEDSAELQDGAPVSSETARRIACDAAQVVMLMDADGTPLDVGRRTRRLSPALERALLTRDRCCQFPGCTNTVYLDAHHIEHWADGGPTKLGNLLLLCRAHHRFVHEQGAVTVPEGGGAPIFFNAHGHSIPRVPPLVPPDPARFPAITDPNVARLVSVCPKPDYAHMLEGLYATSRLGEYATVPPPVPPGAAEELGVDPKRYWLQG